MPLGQGFLNSWLKVNNKHVVIPNKNDKEGRVEGSKQATRTNIRKPSPETVTTERTSKSTEDERTQIIRRFSNRKNKKRLNRTVSASDLIRDKIAGKGNKKFNKDGVVDNDYGSKAPSTTSSNSIFGSNRSQHQTPQHSIFGGSTRSQHQQRHHDEGSSKSSTIEASSKSSTIALHEEQITSASASLHEEPTTTTFEANGSLRFVAGFFGADIDALSLGNDVDHNAKADSSSVMSRGEGSVPTRIKHKGGGKMGIRFPPNIFALESIPAENKKKCQKCSNLENKLALAQEDVEYLRGISLRNENSYSQHQENQHMEISYRSSLLEQAESAQETEIIEMKKEWAAMEDERQQEIQKYSDLCVKLNEEAEFRSEEAMSLHLELNAVSLERDEMATEVETLRAKVAEYEKRDAERRKAEEVLQQYEEHGLGFATREIGARDAIIENLSKRLEFALDTLSMEREKQNQRRQIIFPKQRNKDASSASDVERELKATKESLQKAEETIELLRQQNNGDTVRDRMRLSTHSEISETHSA